MRKILEEKMKFDFTEDEYNYIIKKAMLNDELSKILEMRIKDYSIVKISMELHMSVRTVNRRIKEIKRKISRL